MKKSEFVGNSMRDALVKARQVMGDDAMIIDSEQTDKGMKIYVTTPEEVDIPLRGRFSMPITRTDLLNKKSATSTKTENKKPTKLNVKEPNLPIQLQPRTKPQPEQSNESKYSQIQVQSFAVPADNETPVIQADTKTEAPKVSKKEKGVIGPVDLKIPSFSDRPLFKGRDLLSPENPADMVQIISSIAERNQLSPAFCNDWLRIAGSRFLQDEFYLDDCLRDVLQFNETWLEDLTPSTPVILVGPQGSGKTSLIAKLALLLKSQQKNVSVVTLDLQKAAAYEQLSTYMRPLKIDVSKGYEAFLKAKSDAQKFDQIILVDTPGTNVFSESGHSYLYTLTQQVRDPLTLVLPMEMRQNMALEMCEEYLNYNIKNMIGTRNDIAEGFDVLMMMSHKHRLGITLYSDSPKIVDGLHRLTPESLFETISKR